MGEDAESLVNKVLKLLRNEEVSVEGAVALCQERLGVRKDLAIKSIYLLEKKGLITLEDPSPPQSFLRYVANYRSFWFWMTLLAVTLTALAIYVIPQQPPFIYLRYAVGALYVLYLPGFALIESLYPKKEDLAPVERFALSVGLSLALVPLVGLVLNYTPWGIRLDPIFYSLALLTVLLSALALVRKYSYFKLSLLAVHKIRR